MNWPAGTTTLPPPAPWQAAIAFWNASVQSERLSPTAPNLVMSKSRSGKSGALMRARISANPSHGDCGSTDIISRGQPHRPSALPAARAAPPAIQILRNSRRFCMLVRSCIACYFRIFDRLAMFLKEVFRMIIVITPYGQSVAPAREPGNVVLDDDRGAAFLRLEAGQ